MRFLKAAPAPLLADITRRRMLAATASACATGGAWRSATSATTQPAPGVPVLVYHRFGLQVTDSMTVRTARLREHIDVLRGEGCQIVSLHDVVAWHRGDIPDLPPRPVALSIDDGHRSVADEAAPWLQGTGWPITLFIYPSAISNARYAMTWDTLRALQSQGPWQIESHTWWHPHFARERRQRSAADFERFATAQLTRSRDELTRRSGRPVSLLAWPFGVSDAGVQALAARCGYRAAFGLGGRACRGIDPVMDLPRHLMVDAVSGATLAAWLRAAHNPHPHTTDR